MRDEFPIFQAHPELIYLDSAATTHKPRCVIEALTQAYARDYATVHRAAYRASLAATAQYDQTRITAARFLNAAHPEEIIFTRGTTDAINLVAQSYGRTYLQPGDVILVSEMEHHSNLVPWQMLAQQTGATLQFIPMNLQGVLEWHIPSNTKLVAIAHASNVTGTIHPIAEICRAAHAMGAVVVVDGAQAAPHLKIDVQALDCDFYAFSGHKCYGPTGVGVLYGKKSFLEQMPPIQGGGDMIERVELQASTYQMPPLRFEAGTPMIAEVIALNLALEFVEQHRESSSFLTYATEQMQTIPGLQIIGTAPDKVPLISFHIAGVHPLDVATMLDLRNIAVRSGHLCAQPCLRKFGLTTVARASFGLYNSFSEVDQLVDGLKSSLRILQV